MSGWRFFWRGRGSARAGLSCGVAALLSLASACTPRAAPEDPRERAMHHLAAAIRDVKEIPEPSDRVAAGIMIARTTQLAGDSAAAVAYLVALHEEIEADPDTAYGPPGSVNGKPTLYGDLRRALRSFGAMEDARRFARSDLAAANRPPWAKPEEWGAGLAEELALTGDTTAAFVLLDSLDDGSLAQRTLVSLAAEAATDRRPDLFRAAWRRVDAPGDRDRLLNNRVLAETYARSWRTAAVLLDSIPSDSPDRPFLEASVAEAARAAGAGREARRFALSALAAPPANMFDPTAATAALVLHDLGDRKALRDREASLPPAARRALLLRDATAYAARGQEDSALVFVAATMSIENPMPPMGGTGDSDIRDWIAAEADSGRIDLALRCAGVLRANAERELARAQIAAALADQDHPSRGRAILDTVTGPPYAVLNARAALAEAWSRQAQIDEALAEIDRMGDLEGAAKARRDALARIAATPAGEASLDRLLRAGRPEDRAVIRIAAARGLLK